MHKIILLVSVTFISILSLNSCGAFTGVDICKKRPCPENMECKPLRSGYRCFCPTKQNSPGSRNKSPDCSWNSGVDRRSSSSTRPDDNQLTVSRSLCPSSPVVIMCGSAAHLKSSASSPFEKIQLVALFFLLTWLTRIYWLING